MIGKLFGSTQAVRLSFFILYGIILLVGNALILLRISHGPKTSQELPLSFKANDTLPENRLLKPGDLNIVAGTHPWYLKHGVQKGQTVGLDDLSPMPAIVEKPGKLPVIIAVASSLVTSGEIDAGAKVRICQGGKILIDPVGVQAVFCLTGTEGCIGIADIPADKAASLAGAYQTGGPTSMQTVNKLCQ